MDIYMTQANENPKRVGYQGIRKLRVGDKRIYQAGRGNHRTGATVNVAKKPGTTGVFVTIESFVHKGSAVEHQVNDEILAGAMEI